MRSVSADSEGCSKSSSSSSTSICLKELLLIMSLLIFTFLYSTLPATYLPIIFKEELGLSESISAALLSSTTFAYSFSCLISPKLDDRFNANVILVVSYGVFLITAIAFSFILYLPTSYVTPVAVVIRAVGGICGGIFENGVSINLVRKYRNKIGTVSSAIEMAINVGILVGPLFGGVMYNWTKSYLITQITPCLAIIVIFIIFACSVNFDNGGGGYNNSQQRGGFLKVLGTWPMVLLLFTPFFLSTCESLTITITASYVEETFNGSSIVTGLLFFCLACGYLTGCFASGYLTDRIKYRWLAIWCFAFPPFSFAVSWFIAGPAFFLTFTPTVYTLGAAFFTGSFGFGIASGPMLLILLSVWRGLEKDEKVDYTAYITSTLLITYSFGECVGNAVGGVLYQSLSYSQIFTIFGFMLLSVGSVNLTFTLLCRKKKYIQAITLINIDNESESERESEYSPLIPGDNTNSYTTPDDVIPSSSKRTGDII